MNELEERLAIAAEAVTDGRLPRDLVEGLAFYVQLMRRLRRTAASIRARRDQNAPCVW